MLFLYYYSIVVTLLLWSSRRWRRAGSSTDTRSADGGSGTSGFTPGTYTMLQSPSVRRDWWCGDIHPAIQGCRWCKPMATRRRLAALASSPRRGRKGLRPPRWIGGGVQQPSSTFWASAPGSPKSSQQWEERLQINSSDPLICYHGIHSLLMHIFDLFEPWKLSLCRHTLEIAPYWQKLLLLLFAKKVTRIIIMFLSQLSKLLLLYNNNYLFIIVVIIIILIFLIIVVVIFVMDDHNNFL